MLLHKEGLKKKHCESFIRYVYIYIYKNIGTLYILFNTTKAKLNTQHFNYFLGTLTEIMCELLKINF